MDRGQVKMQLQNCAEEKRVRRLLILNVQSKDVSRISVATQHFLIEVPFILIDRCQPPLACISSLLGQLGDEVAFRYINLHLVSSIM